METCGLIAEYNPFHNGHKQQLQVIREQFGPEAGVVICLSGPFCQRGIPALLDKGVRAHIALSMGADLILELPQAFAVTSAERFAEGAVQTLLATGIVRNIAYGTEQPEQHENIRNVAAILADEPPELGEIIRNHIALGTGFAAARSQALDHITGNPSLGALLRDSNTILAVEYEKALVRYNYGATVQDNGHPAPVTTHAFPLFDKEKMSASAIRDRIWEALELDRGEDYLPLMRTLALLLPPASVAAVMDAVTRGKGLLFDEMIAPLFLLAPVFSHLDRLKQIHGMQGGLAERLVNAFRDDPASVLQKGATPYETFVRSLATRNHPASRIRRAIISAAMGIENDHNALTKIGPTYLRVLGFTKRGKRLLSFMRHTASLPIIVNTSDFRKLEDPSAIAQAKLDLHAQAVWNLHAGYPDRSEFMRDVLQAR